MDRLNSQRKKRLRRHASHEANRANKQHSGELVIADGVAEGDVTIFVTRAGNAKLRKLMKRRGLLAANIATTVAEGFAKIPKAWKGTCQVKLPAGKYGVG